MPDNSIEYSNTIGFQPNHIGGDLRPGFQSYYIGEWRYFDPHCLLLFVSWNFLSILLVGVNRWCGHWWRWYMFIHSTIGLALTYLTIWLAIRATVFLKKRIEVNAHSIGGFFLLGFILFLSASGYVTLYMARMKLWEQHTIENWRKLHKRSGWVFVAVGLITSASGVFQYYREIDPGTEWGRAIYCYLIFFFFLGVTELNFRLERTKEDPFIYPT
jgi:hypothetical protein